MAETEPNDVFQFSTFTAFNAGYKHGQISTDDLLSHGADGIGIYDDGTLMMLRNGEAFSLQRDGTAELASVESHLSFAMVTVYQPTFRARIPSLTLEGLEELASSPEYGPARGINTLMPFKVTGVFESIELNCGIKKNIPGTIFGFIVPAWMKHISGPRIQAHFLDANETLGSSVADFYMGEDATLSFAKCGTFHMGFPEGDAWEDLKL